MRRAMILAPALLLAACGSNERSDEGTEISIRGGGDNTMSAALGKDGKVAIDLPGFKANIDLPSIQLDANDFKLNGVSLPAGSKITSMNLAGNGDVDSKGAFEVHFTTPGPVTGVREWFQGRLAGEGFTLKAQDDGLTGTTDEGKAFRLTTNAAGQGSESVITIGG